MKVSPAASTGRHNTGIETFGSSNPAWSSTSNVRPYVLPHTLQSAWPRPEWQATARGHSPAPPPDDRGRYGQVPSADARPPRQPFPVDCWRWPLPQTSPFWTAFCPTDPICCRNERPQSTLGQRQPRQSPRLADGSCPGRPFCNRIHPGGLNNP